MYACLTTPNYEKKNLLINFFKRFERLLIMNGIKENEKKIFAFIFKLPDNIIEYYEMNSTAENTYKQAKEILISKYNVGVFINILIIITIIFLAIFPCGVSFFGFSPSFVTIKCLIWMKSSKF